MEELGKRILEGRAFQKKVVGMMLSVLARALKVCRSLDPMVSGEIDTFPEDFVFILGIYGSRHPVILQNRSRGLINGEITQAMRFLRCIQRAQAYLIPACMANQVLPLQEPLPVKRWKVWLRMLHVKKRKPGEQED